MINEQTGGIQCLEPYPGPRNLSSYEKQIPQFFPYNNLWDLDQTAVHV